MGENAYSGMRDNLAASTDLRTRSDPIARAASESEVPLQTALSLMLREALTGQPVPESARAGVEMVRESIESRIGDDFERLALSIDDQKAFQSLSLDPPRHLEMGATDEFDDRGDEDRDGDDEDGGEDKDGDDGEDAGDELRPQEMTGEQGEDDGESEQVPSEQDMSEG